MINKNYGANAPVFFMKNKIPEVDQAMNIYKKYMSDEEYKDYIETRELMAEMDENERLAEAKEEGQTQKAIELAVKLIKTGKMSLGEAIIFCGLDKNQEEQIKKLLNQ